MAKRGPKGPSTEVNWDAFEKLCRVQCTEEEIADAFDMSVDTLQRHVKRKYKMNFADIYKRKSSLGKISLRRSMWKSSRSGNVTMQIWLSKNMLGMSDKIETKTEDVNETSALLNKTPEELQEHFEEAFKKY